MKLADLHFDNPNNACLSLRILAEKVRTGEASVLLVAPGVESDALDTVRVTVALPKSGRTATRREVRTLAAAKEPRRSPPRR